MIPTILLYGGCGPRANAFAHQKLFSLCAADYDAHHDNSYPSVISIDTPAKLTTSKGITDIEAYQNTFKSVVDVFTDQFNIQTVIPVCNSSADALKIFTQHYNIVCLPEEAIKSLRKEEKGNLAALCSFTSWQTNVFSNRILQPYVECKLSLTEIQELENIIWMLMGKHNTDKIHSAFASFIEHIVIKYQLQYLILGCTELSMIDPNFLSSLEASLNFQFIDSLTASLKTSIFNYYESI